MGYFVCVKYVKCVIHSLGHSFIPFMLLGVRNNHSLKSSQVKYLFVCLLPFMLLGTLNEVSVKSVFVCLPKRTLNKGLEKSRSLFYTV